MRRRKPNLGVALSLLLFVATGGVWAMSRLSPGSYIRQTWDPARFIYRQDVFSCYGGAVSFGRTRIDLDMEVPPWPSMRRPWSRLNNTQFDRPMVPGWRVLSWAHMFRVRHSRYPGWYEGWGIQFELWPIAVCATIWPALSMARMIRRRRRTRSGLCPSCGYDLRGTSERCPECGAVPETHPTIAARPAA